VVDGRKNPFKSFIQGVLNTSGGACNRQVFLVFKRVGRRMKYFLVYIDILGFEKVGQTDTLVQREEVRDVFRKRITDRLNELKNKTTIVTFREQTTDSWLLFTLNIWNAFRAVGKVSEAELPLEIAIGVEEYDKSAVAEELIYLNDKTISAMKNLPAMMYAYKNQYKQQHGGESIKETFILLTEAAHKELGYDNICSDKLLEQHGEWGFYPVKLDEFPKMLKTLEFLERIGSERKEYRYIEELYVEPTRFAEIKEILDKHNIVFIIGDPQIGKTYTAIKLLLEFFKTGNYEPRYISEEEKREQWEFLKKFDIEEKVEGKAIYFEDPWGKSEFQEAESLLRDMGKLVAIAQRQNCKIIVTSREGVFKEYKDRRETAEDLESFVSSLKVNLAYTTEHLEQMLKNYIDIFKPRWGSDSLLVAAALSAVKNGRLRTPMSIGRLIENTKGVEDIQGLMNGIYKVAEETKTAFAAEIRAMFRREQYDKIVFLSFPYIGIKPELAKTCYSQVLKELGINPIKCREFDDLREEFKEVEVKSEGLGYIHPSYREGFDSALTDNGRPNNISKRVFSVVLLRLSVEEEAAERVGITVAVNFEKIPDHIRNALLLKLAENDEAAWVVVWAVARNFDKLPEEVRGLLFKLAENDETAWAVAWAVAENFEKLPEEVRGLLFKLAENNKTAWVVARPVAENFNKLPEEVRGLLFKLAENDEIAWAVAWAVARNFDQLPEEVRGLLFKLAENNKTAWAVARPVVENFNKLPEEVRGLLFKLAENNETAGAVARAVARNFDKLPEEVRGLLFKLAENDETAWAVALAIAANFDKLPEAVRGLLFKLAENNEAAGAVAHAITANFDKLPEAIRGLLFKLAENNETAGDVARAVARNFDKLPESIRGLLFKLAENNEAAGAVARAVARNFDKLPEEVRGLLFKLAENDKTREDVAQAVAENVDKIPEDVRKSLGDILGQQL